MMASSKHLKQLLNEDQEPFVLKNYIDERRLQLNKQVKRQKPISENSSFPSNFCKKACFFSFHDSPDVRNSPLFDFSSPIKTPSRNSNTLFVHIPSKTAALLLEAALRIQKQSDFQKSKNLRFGFFGSILKRIKSRKREIKRVSVKDILRWESIEVTEENRESREISVGLEEKRVSDVGLSCSCNSRVSSAWTESNEEKSLDLETSTSRSDEEGSEEETESIVQERKNNGDFDLCEKTSPFRIILQNSSSPDRRSPDSVYPATSPNRRKTQVVKNEEGHLNCVAKENKQEEEHCSPVSVLDLQFEEHGVEGQDDKEEEEEEEEDEDEDEDGSELERSLVIVQRTKQKLLQKLRRFERLAELDPVELEKRIAEDEDDEEFNDSEEEDIDDDDNDSVLQDNEKGDVFIRDVRSGSDFSNRRRIPLDMKRLVVDLMSVEGKVACSNDKVLVANKVCKRLGSWKKVEANTVNMMIETDFRGERDEWQKNHEHVQEMASELEFAIFGFLVEELSVELVHSSDL